MTELWIDPSGLRDVAATVRETVTPLTEAVTDIDAAGAATGSAGHDLAVTALTKYTSWWGPYASTLAEASEASASTMESIADAFTTSDEATANAFARFTTGPGTGQDLP